MSQIFYHCDLLIRRPWIEQNQSKKQSNHDSITVHATKWIYTTLYCTIAKLNNKDYYAPIKGGLTDWSVS